MALVCNSKKHLRRLKEIEQLRVSRVSRNSDDGASLQRHVGEKIHRHAAYTSLLVRKSTIPHVQAAGALHLCNAGLKIVTQWEMECRPRERRQNHGKGVVGEVNFVGKILWTVDPVR